MQRTHLFVLAAGCAAAAHAQDLTPIALTGQQAPGVEPGVGFARLSPPAISDSGDYVFFATLAGDGLSQDRDEGVFALREGALQLVVRESDPAPWFTPDTRFVGLSDFAIDLLGRVVLAASVDDPNVSDPSEKARALGIFREERLNEFEPLARIGEPAADLPGEVYQTLHSPVVSPDSTVFFTAGTTTDFDDSAPLGLWTDSTGVAALLLAPGDPAPGTSGEVFSHFERPRPGERGDFVIRAAAKPEGSTDRALTGVWAKIAGTLGLIARQGEPAPGTTTTFAGFPNQPVINEGGEVAFRAELNTSEPTDTGIWTNRSGALSLLVREGDDAPGTDSATIGEISYTLSFNAQGEIAFRCDLITGDNNSNGAIYLARADGTFDLIALEGDGILDELGDVSIASMGDPILGDRSDMLFRATLQGDAVTPDSNQALLGVDTQRRLFSIAREGEVVDPFGNTPLTIRSIFIDASRHRAGRDVIDLTGFAGLTLSFENGSSGVFAREIHYASPADIDKNRVVDSRDLVAFLAAWSAQDPVTDFDRNGEIDTRDVVEFLNVWSRDRS